MGRFCEWGRRSPPLRSTYRQRLRRAWTWAQPPGGRPPLWLAPPLAVHGRPGLNWLQVQV